MQQTDTIQRRFRKRSRADAPEAAAQRVRVPLLDSLRGLAIVAMIVYHTLYDLVVMYHVDIPLFSNWALRLFQVLIASTFILVSGASAQFSRNIAKRGIICFGVGMLLTAFTMVFLPEFSILFGILHLLGCSMILYAFLQRPLDKIPPVVGIVVFFLLFLFTYDLPDGAVGIPGVVRLVLPRWMYMNQYLFPIGLPHPSFWSSDYFSIFPWTFRFLVGTYVGRLAKDRRLPGFVYRAHKGFGFLRRLGHWSLPIYVAHQPVIYGALWLLSALGWL